MAKNKLTVDFAELETYRKKLNAISGDAARRAFESALKASQQIVKQSVTAAMSTHNQSGQTVGTAIADKPVEWNGETASIPVGFDIAEGGLASVFLMYGTTLYGQPHVTPDRKLYQAVYGTAIRKKIRSVQENAFRKVIERTMK